jgi:hypothetical protein
MSRERINISLTQAGMALLDEERESMGLSRSGMIEVLLRFWVRDKPPIEQVRAASDGGESEELVRRKAKPKKKSR